MLQRSYRPAGIRAGVIVYRVSALLLGARRHRDDSMKSDVSTAARRLLEYVSAERRDSMPADRNGGELLRAVARRPTGAATERIDQLAGKVGDWESLFRLAAEHRVLPMLFSRLADTGAPIPPVAQERLRAEYDRNVFHCLTNAAELIAVLKAFDGEKIPAMPFKGVVLGASVYHDLMARSAGDLDVLIHYEYLLRATAILLERGYELKTPVRADGTPAAKDYYEYHFERPADGMVIDFAGDLSLRSQGSNAISAWIGYGRGAES